eukprot:6466464-Amphidinium_carterae.1
MQLVALTPLLVTPLQMLCILRYRTSSGGVARCVCRNQNSAECISKGLVGPHMSELPRVRKRFVSAAGDLCIAVLS